MVTAGVFASVSTGFSVSPFVDIEVREVLVDDSSSALSVAADVGEILAPQPQSLTFQAFAEATTEIENPSVSVSEVAFESNQLFYLIEAASGALFRGTIGRGETLSQDLPSGTEFNLLVFSPATNRTFVGSGSAGATGV